MTTPPEQASRPGDLRRWLKILPEVVIIALSVPMWVATSEWSSTAGGLGPAFYPRLLLALLALAMVVRIAHEILTMRRVGARVDEEGVALEEGVEMDVSLMDMRRVAVAVALSVTYVIASLFLGWVLATFVLVIVFLWLAGKRNLLITVPVALLFSLGMAYVFVKIVYIALPTGVGAFDQFTVLLFELLGVY